MKPTILVTLVLLAPVLGACSPPHDAPTPVTPVQTAASAAPKPQVAPAAAKPKPKRAACPVAPHTPPRASLVGSCKVDTDCTQGRNGRCIEVASTVGPGKPKPGLMIRACVADDCYVDSDCERGQLCFCGTGAAGVNECAESECHDDADCAGRECAEESLPPGLSPPRLAPHYCRTAGDQCKRASDCREGVACIYNKDWRRFECGMAALR